MVPDALRCFTAAGNEAFRLYLTTLRASPSTPPPFHFLVDTQLSVEISDSIQVAQEQFTNRYDLGERLVKTLAPLGRRQISFNNGLWNWLALYYFESICPLDAANRRNVLRDELYVIDDTYNYLRYYKHLVRTPWLAVLEHGANAQVLFRNARGVRSDIEETLAASQQVLGDRTIIETAFKLYFDESTGKPKSGASGKAAGSPRRLTALVQQLALTFDIQSCSSDQFLAMLPVEFNRFKAA